MRPGSRFVDPVFAIQRYHADSCVLTHWYHALGHGSVEDHPFSLEIAINTRRCLPEVALVMLHQNLQPGPCGWQRDAMRTYR